MDLTDCWNIALPKTWHAWRTAASDLVEIAEAELSDCGDELASSAASEGWPEDPDVRLTNLVDRTDTMTIAATLWYTEVVPSSCADMPHRNSRELKLILSMHSESAEAEVEFAPQESEGWALDERNSAADGC